MPESESPSALWIYVNQDAWPGNHDLALFRRLVNLDGAPQQVTARISADVCFRLYVNGVMVARGPDDIGSDIPIIVKDRYALSTQQWLYVVRDLTPYFRAGDNVIAAEVFSYCRAGAYLSAGKSGFWFDAQVTGADGSVMSIASDSSWQSRPGKHVVCGYAGTLDEEHTSKVDLTYVAAEEPVDWLDEDDAADQWQPATEIESTWDPMAASQIPPCMEARYPEKEIVVLDGPIEVPAEFVSRFAAAPEPLPCHPERSRGISVFDETRDSSTPLRSARNDSHVEGIHPIRITGDGSFCLRVDRVIPAYVGFRVDGCDGAELVFRWEETLDDTNRAAACVLRDGEQTFEFPGYGSCTYLRVEAHHVTRPIAIQDIRLIFTSQPVEYAGSFECSDPQLNALWKSARHALQICMQTHHLDSPHHQEPISDPGDYLIEALMNYQAFGAPWLARQDVRKFAQVLRTVNYLNFHTSYSLLWIQMLMAHYDYTGDGDLVLEVAKQVHGLLNTFASWKGENGLICNAPSYMFMDWVEVAGFNVHHPPAVIGMGYMSAFYYRALADGIRVAELQGNEERVNEYRQQRTDLCEAFNAVLWDEGKGRYRDGVPFVTQVEPLDPWLPADEDIETHTPHVNSLAVLYDLAPQEKQADIMRRVMSDHSVEVQPYFMHFVFDALDHAGVFEEYAIDLMKRWTIVEETGTCYEMWGRGDLSHAWNGTPLYQMSARILGIIPMEPGFSRVAVQPKPCALDYAKGCVPTPHGPVAVEWTRKGDQLDIQIDAPDACSIVRRPLSSTS